MQPTRITTGIEVGAYDGRVGLRLTFREHPSEVFLFDETTAAQLFHQGLAVVEQLRSTPPAPPQGTHATIGIVDRAHVRLVTTGESNGETQEQA